MKLKEKFTSKEANYMSLISLYLGHVPHTFQGNSAYWTNVELDFKNKEVIVNALKFPESMYYLLCGICAAHGLVFVEGI